VTVAASNANADGPRALVVIGASAGGVDALQEVVEALPPDLPAAVCVVLHLAPGSASALPEILARAGRLPVEPATDGQPLREGHVYVAPPDFHLLVDGSHVRLGVGPRENRVRPSVDVLFRSAAQTSGSRVVAVVLTGMLDDGTAGLVEVVRAGGLAVVQDPDSAAFPGMPGSAARVVAPEDVAPIEEVAGIVTEHVHSIVERPTSSPSTPSRAVGR
jgi:two-component system chemotaxis response regulator CheB